LSAWFNTTRVNRYQGAISIGSSSSGASAYIGTVSTAQVGTSNSIGGGFYSRNYGSGITSLNTWVHVVLTYNGTNAIIYVDGSEKVNDSYAPNLSGVYTRIGRIGSDTTFDFSGLIEDVAMWSRALTATEVSDLYRKGVSRLDLNIYSCSDPSCEAKTGAQNISNASNSVWVNLNSSVLNSRYLGIEAYFLKAKGFEDYNAENFWVGSYLKDFNILFYN
jgi:hypothetical protein